MGKNRIELNWMERNWIELHGIKLHFALKWRQLASCWRCVDVRRYVLEHWKVATQMSCELICKEWITFLSLVNIVERFFVKSLTASRLRVEASNWTLKWLQRLVTLQHLPTTKRKTTTILVTTTVIEVTTTTTAIILTTATAASTANIGCITMCSKRRNKSRSAQHTAHLSCRVVKV